MTVIERIVDLAKSEVGYPEHASAAYLDSRTKNIGSANYTKYARDLSDAGLGHPNGYAWCQTFIAWLVWKVTDAEMANKLLCGKLKSASTMDVKDAFVKAGRMVPLYEARTGDIVYRSRSGGGHVGLCIGRAANGDIITVEGNSSPDDKAAWNGGMTCTHTGGYWQWCCRPDWSVAETVTEIPIEGTVLIKTELLNIRDIPSTSGKIVGAYRLNDLVTVTAKSGTWFKTDKGWISRNYVCGWILEAVGKWWYNDKDSYPVNTVKLIKDSWYAFDNEGWMITADRISPSGAIIY